MKIAEREFKAEIQNSEVILIDDKFKNRLFKVSKIEFLKTVLLLCLIGILGIIKIALALGMFKFTLDSWEANSEILMIYIIIIFSFIAILIGAYKDIIIYGVYYSMFSWVNVYNLRFGAGHLEIYNQIKEEKKSFEEKHKKRRR